MNGFAIYVAASAGLALAASAAEAGILIYSRTYRDPPEEVARGSAEVPTLSVIIPAYREGKHVLEALSSAVNLDYPADRLEVLLALEEGDEVTRRALGDLARCEESPCYVRGVEVRSVVHHGGRRSKPAALDAALRAARGEVIGVLDADDVFDREAAKAAVEVLAGGAAAVQLARDARNPDEGGSMTRAQQGELELNNEYLIPAMRRLTGFVPILGSGYFIVRKALEDVGGWDPKAPAEDLDLAIRLYEKGYRVEFLGYPRVHTLAITSLRRLLRQRERWVRGTLLLIPRALRIAGKTWPVLLSYMMPPMAWLLADAWPIIWFLSPGTQALIAGATAISLALYALKLRLQGTTYQAPIVSFVYAVATWLALGRLLLAPRSWVGTRS